MTKDDDTGALKPVSWVFKINRVCTSAGDVNPCSNDHSQSFLYVLVDPMNWHVNIF